MYSSIKTYYRIHAPLYDLTRWAFLFRRKKLEDHLPDLGTAPSILDLGCGTGYHLPQLNKRYTEATIHAIDQSPDMIQRAKQKAHPDACFHLDRYREKLFDENTFDLILCSYSLTMMDHPEHVVDSIRKHLKPGGYLLVLDFDHSVYPWFTDWMHKNFVKMSEELFDLLDRSFSVSTKTNFSAYLGLWQYSLFIGRIT